MSNAISSHGTLVARNGATIGELRNITPPVLARNTFETTTQNDADASFVMGVRRASGDLQFEINFLPSGDATHGQASTGLLYSYNNGLIDRWNVNFPDGSVWMFSGGITSLAVTANAEGALDAKVSVKVTSAFIKTP